VPGRASGPSRSSGQRRRRIVMCSRNLTGSLGFFRRGVFIGEGVMSEGEPGALTRGPRGQATGRATPVCGALVALLFLSFGSLEASGQNKTSGTCFVQFREYFLCITSETQKQQKTGNWHCGNSLIG
jgi:hypothetical protein